MARWVIGVDEAGRGPLAGPVAVGLVAAPEGVDIAAEFPGVDDSKKLAPAARDFIYAQVERRAEALGIRFCARFASARYIDSHGISRALERAIVSGLRRLDVPHRDATVLLDGLLRAPRHYAQETIVRGDALIPLISLASIVAKVRRDRLMRRLNREYPQWGFDAHKGYPTPAHYEAIERWGLCRIHRRSFCKNIALDSSVEEGVVLITG